MEIDDNFVRVNRYNRYTFRGSSSAGYRTVRRTTLCLLSHFVEKAFCLNVSFCRMPTTSKQVFVEYFRRNTLCSLGGHIVSADPMDTGEDYWSEADYKILKGARE